MDLSKKVMALVGIGLWILTAVLITELFWAVSEGNVRDVVASILLILAAFFSGIGFFYLSKKA